MARKPLLVMMVVAALAAFVPAEAPAVGLGRACVATFQRGADYGCPFTATGPRLRVFGLAVASGSPASVTVWVTASENPTDPALLTCMAPALPAASACRASAGTERSGVQMYCWASGSRGVFGCTS